MELSATRTATQELEPSLTGPKLADADKRLCAQSTNLVQSKDREVHLDFQCTVEKQLHDFVALITSKKGPLLKPQANTSAIGVDSTPQVEAYRLCFRKVCHVNTRYQRQPSAY